MANGGRARRRPLSQLKIRATETRSSGVCKVRTILPNCHQRFCRHDSRSGSKGDAPARRGRGRRPRAREGWDIPGSVHGCSGSLSEPPVSRCRPQCANRHRVLLSHVRTHAHARGGIVAATENSHCPEPIHAQLVPEMRSMRHSPRREWRSRRGRERHCGVARRFCTKRRVSSVSARRRWETS